MPIAANHEKGEYHYLDDQGAWQPAPMARGADKLFVWDGKSWIEPPKVRSLGQTAEDIGRSIASGATAGFSDELAAGAKTLTGQGGYEENLAAYRARDKEIPGAVAAGGEIAGGVASSLLVPALAPARLAGAAARLPGIVRNVGAGALGGAAYGAGSAEGDLASRGLGAVQGAAAGAAIGATVPYVAKAAISTAAGLRNAVSPEANVARDLGRAILRDKDTPETIMKRVSDASIGRPGMVTLADAGGENVRGLVERVAQTPGAGRTELVPFLIERQKQQIDRLGHDLSHLTGTAKTAYRALEDTMAARKAAAGPLYDQAFNFNARTDPNLVTAWQNATSTGWGRSFLSNRDFRTTLQTEYGIANAADAPLMVQIDAWKKVTDGAIGAARRAGNENQVRVLTTMRNGVIDALDNAQLAAGHVDPQTGIPLYQAARNAWAGPSRYLDAIEEGRGIFSKKISAEEMTADFQRLSGSEQEAYRIGALSAIRGSMGGDAAKMPDLTKYLRSPEVRAKIRAIMPDQAIADKWETRLGFEIGSHELANRALGNSATARRLAERADADGIMGELVGETLIGAPTASLWKRAAGAVRDTARSQADEKLAKTLVDPAMTMPQLRQVLGRAQTRAAPIGAGPQIGAATGANALYNYYASP